MLHPDYSFLKEKYKEVLKLTKHYQLFNIFFLNRERGRVAEYKSLTTLTEEQYFSLWLKHKRRKEEVLLQPEVFDCFFIDDPKRPNWKDLVPHGSIVIETSPGKYQIHIPIPFNHFEKFNLTDDFELKKKIYTKAANILFQADHIAWNQLRKLPTFLNWKYTTPPVPEVKIINIDTKISFDEWLFKHIQPLLPDLERSEIAKKVASTTRLDNIPRTKPRLSWNDFYNGDRSQADIRYAVYLFSRGYSWDEVRKALLNESPQIFERKKGHIEDYLNRTLAKAYEYAKKTWKPIEKTAEPENIPF